MGQYYKFINLDKKEKSDRNMYPLKLTEHSYVGNDYCNDTLTLLSDKWEGDRVIHVGDYATNTDNSTTSHLISKLDREFKPNTTFFNYGEYFKDVEPDKINKKIRYVYNLDNPNHGDILQTILMIIKDRTKVLQVLRNVCLSIENKRKQIIHII